MKLCFALETDCMKIVLQDRLLLHLLKTEMFVVFESPVFLTGCANRAGNSSLS